MRVSSASGEWFEREMISLSMCLGHEVGDENGVFFKIITFEIDKKIWVENTSDICYRGPIESNLDTSFFSKRIQNSQ